MAKLASELRHHHRLTQGDVAKKAGVSITTISNLERGSNDGMQLKTICSIAKALDIHLLCLLGFGTYVLSYAGKALNEDVAAIWLKTFYAYAD